MPKSFVVDGIVYRYPALDVRGHPTVWPRPMIDLIESPWRRRCEQGVCQCGQIHELGRHIEETVWLTTGIIVTDTDPYVEYWRIRARLGEQRYRQLELRYDTIQAGEATFAGFCRWLIDHGTP